MRVLIILLVALAACGGGNAVEPPPPAASYRVLFIGNSLTYFNDLPGTVAQLASSTNTTIEVASVARPNFALIDHMDGKSNAVEMIDGAGWDYVILQQGPSSLQQVRGLR